jgi:hypothetical protein
MEGIEGMGGWREWRDGDGRMGDGEEEEVGGDYIDLHDSRLV